MDDNVSFKITIEFICHNMIEAKSLAEDFNNDPMLAYKYMSDDFTDSVYNFSDEEKIIKVEVIE